jgi:hypothetical protein
VEQRNSLKWITEDSNGQIGNEIRFNSAHGIATQIVVSRVGGVRMTDIVSSRFDWLDLLGVSITISLDYNSSHISLLLDNESLTVVWILH